MSRIEIRLAAFRDVCFVAAHMRERDRREVYCQLPEGARSVDVAVLSYGDGEHAYCAWERGSPVAAFGIAQASFSSTVRSAWAFGTRRMRRAVPAISRFGLETLAPLLLAQGVLRLEARSIADHDLAHRWLAVLGARREAELRRWGRGGETFVLWSWTDKEWRDAHVLQSENPEDPAQADGAEP